MRKGIMGLSQKCCTVYPFTADCAVCSVQCTVYSVQCTVYSVQCTVYSVQCTLYSVQYILTNFPDNIFRYIEQNTVYTRLCTQKYRRIYTEL